MWKGLGFHIYDVILTFTLHTSFEHLHILNFSTTPSDYMFYLYIGVHNIPPHTTILRIKIYGCFQLLRLSHSRKLTYSLFHKSTLYIHKKRSCTVSLLNYLHILYMTFYLIFIFYDGIQKNTHLFKRPHIYGYRDINNTNKFYCRYMRIVVNASCYVMCLPKRKWHFLLQKVESQNL